VRESHIDFDIHEKADSSRQALGMTIPLSGPQDQGEEKGEQQQLGANKKTISPAKTASLKSIWRSALAELIAIC